MSRRGETQVGFDVSFPRGSLLSLGVQHGVAPGVDLHVVAVASYALMQQRGFKRNPDKARRYQVLPLQYKLAYGLVVLPMIVAVPLILLFVFDWPYLAVAAHVLGLVAYAGLEIACVSVYRRHGLWS